MRGVDQQQEAMFSYVSPERRVPKDHPLRVIWVLADAVLVDLSGKFAALYSPIGRSSIPPEKLLRALLLQALYSIRSERILMEELDYNLLFRWFVGLNADEPVWDASTFSKNRDRLLEGDIAREFFVRVRAVAAEHGLLSDEHFTVDGTMIEAWAGQKSFRSKESSGPGPRDPDGGGVNFRGERRSNETHESTTDPDARLYRKTNHGEAKLCYLGHVLIENRNGLVVDVRLTRASGTAEREAALDMAASCKAGSTLGADKAYDTRDFVARLRQLKVVPHVAQNTSGRRSAIDARTTRHPGYAISQFVRHRVERVFGWGKTVGLIRKTRHRGQKRVEWMFTFTAAAYDLVRIGKLIAATG
jgi:transposase